MILNMLLFIPVAKDAGCKRFRSPQIFPIIIIIYRLREQKIAIVVGLVLVTQPDYYLKVPLLPSNYVVPPSVTTRLLGSGGTAL